MRIDHTLIKSIFLLGGNEFPELVVDEFVKKLAEKIKNFPEYSCMEDCKKLKDLLILALETQPNCHELIQKRVKPLEQVLNKAFNSTYNSFHTETKSLADIKEISFNSKNFIQVSWVNNMKT